MFNLPSLPNEQSPIVHECIVNSSDKFQWNTPLSEIATFHLSSMTDDEMDNDWKLNDFFGTIAVINMQKADLRREQIKNELTAINCTFEFFEGVDGSKDVSPKIWSKFYGTRGSDLDPNTEEGKLALDKIDQGRAGCYLSHYYLIKKMKESFDVAMVDYQSALNSQDPEVIRRTEKEVRKYSRILILEDDAAFGVVNEDNSNVIKKNVGKRLRLAIKELPDNWDMFYLIVKSKEEPEEVSDHLCKIKSSNCQVGYAINYTMYEPIINLLKAVEDPQIQKTRAVDLVIGLFHHLHHVYALKRSVIYHQPGLSFIANKVNNEVIQPNPWPYIPKLQELEGK